MKNHLSNIEKNINSEIDFKEEFFKYLFFWKYFALSLTMFIVIAFFINRYSHKIFDTNAKIQILDKKENSLIMPTAEDLFSNSKINLENEIEIIKSANILEEVIKNLKLNCYVEGVGEIMTSRLLDYPFDFISKVHLDSTKNSSFNIELHDKGITITNNSNDKNYSFDKFSTLGIKHDLPFDILSVNHEKWIEESYNLNYISTYNLINDLKTSINVSKIGNKSDIINLNLKNSNYKYSELLLNELIDVFNNDGVRDRQLIFKRTIDFVNERYNFLASELDSIEKNKKDFKIKNNLVDFNINSSISLEKNRFSEQAYLSNENQIYLVSSLLDELLETNLELLPSNIGIEDFQINSLISSFNELVLEQKKIIISAGPENPYVKQLDVSITDVRNNIISTLKNYVTQLNLLQKKYSEQLDAVDKKVMGLPAQEKNLRAIERNQSIKEALYLFLLQKGEEAQVSFAITEPSLKVVEYAISSSKPISPNTKVIYLIAILAGVFLPFSILFLKFSLDTKIHSREDLSGSSFNFNLLGEIPFFDSLSEKEKVFVNPEDRSIVSEAFRMLMSNVRYLQKKDSKSNVILVTSSIKGEGKTLNALNLALSFSSVGKKVLLIGCDLRNPQLHKYISFDKNVNGLVDYLFDKKNHWKKNIINPFENHELDILLSGPLPPNPLNLINNGNIDVLLNDARKLYDYIIIDSAPTLLVADTKSLFNKADILIFLTRCNITDKEILHHIAKTEQEIEANVGIILNGVGQKDSYGYSYGYRYGYGYGYNYKYSYNYGYGYGYSSDDEKS